MAKTLNSRVARQNWRTVLDDAHLGEDTIIERNGKAIAVVIPWPDYWQIAEELNAMRSRRKQDPEESPRG